VIKRLHPDTKGKRSRTASWFPTLRFKGKERGFALNFKGRGVNFEEGHDTSL